MVKKVILIAGGATLLGVVLVGTNAVSYISTSAGYMSDSVRNSVPIEFEIERARGMIRDLVPEVRKNMYVIAKEEVEVKRLEEQITKAQATIEKEKDGLMRLKSDLATGENVFKYAGRSYTADQVRVDLANRFERFKTGDATLASLQQIHSARQRSLESARQKLAGMLSQKRQLQVEVENLEARLQMIAAAKTTSEFQFDDSRLGRAKELISSLQTRLDVADSLIQAETNFCDEIPLDRVSPEEIVDQVTEYFAVPISEDGLMPEIEAIAAD